ncbi:cytochrome protein [Xylariaceae sp. FL0662B]|nr:cytochrome protein [Xylariaceae sp. FL0662B]
MILVFSQSSIVFGTVYVFGLMISSTFTFVGIVPDPQESREAYKPVFIGEKKERRIDGLITVTSSLVLAGLVVLTSLFIRVVVKGFRIRLKFYRLRQQGMPMPPWNPILGHLPAIMPVMKTLPEDRQQPDAFEPLCRAHQKEDGDSIIYLDMWPFSAPLMIICSPLLAVQACSQEYDLSKPPMLHAFFNPLAGGENLFTMNGPEWKRSRALFNPGFSANYISRQTSHIVDEAEVYVDILREHARKGAVFSLDDVTCWYLMDVIGAVTLDSRLHCQRQFNPLASALRRQIRYFGQELDKRYAEWTKDKASSRSIIHLALEGYMGQQKGKPRPKRLDPAFKKWASVQIRLFLFAGHDSTSSTICYCFYPLESHPEAMSKLRAEHDAVFGSVIETASKLREEPHLLNQLPYTTAVIKEVLRLFPPASAMRGGDHGVYLKDEQGNMYPTEGTNLWILHSALQHDPKYWTDPLGFRPERWLVGPEDPLHPIKGGWRPFEHGPRNCLGQTLAMQDVKITLILTVREFEIRHGFDEWDGLHPTSKIKHVNGERAYQTQSGGAHPADGDPCRISLRK